MNKLLTRFTKQDIKKAAMILVGTAIYAFGLNIFIVPVNLYSGGFMGMAQIIRTLMRQYLGVNPPFDYAGIVSLIINIPVLYFTRKQTGKDFIIKTVVCLMLQTVLLSVIPVTQVIEDHLTSCIIGGILTGFGIGLMLQNGGSSGGADVLGVYFSKKSSSTVGKVNMIVNIFVYGCAFILMANIERIIYTLIYQCISMFTLDRVHTQNINSEVMIFSKHNDAEIQNAIMLEMRRGVSYWEGYGAFTGDENRVLYTVVSKYEIPQLMKIVRRVDPQAFVSVQSGINVMGNFEKRL